MKEKNKKKVFRLQEGEKILKEVFHHHIVIIPHLIACFFILILDFFLMYYLFLQGWWGVALFVAVIIIVGFYIFRLAFLYKHNKFIVTNQRIVDIEQPGFFEKYLNAFSFDKIKRSEAVVKGLGSMIFRYGNLKLHLKEDVGPFELYKVAKPLRLQQFINELLQDNRPKSSQKDLKPMDLIMEEAGFLNDGQKRKIIDLLEKQLDKEESKRD